MSALFSVDDMGVFDNLETVTYLDLNPSTEAYTSYTGVTAFREDLPTTYREGVAQRSCRFHLQASTLNGGVTTPTEDSQILDGSGITWVITSIDLLTWETRYQCETLELMS